MRTPSPRHRFWAIPLTVVALLLLTVVAVAALVPASAVSRKDVPDPDHPGQTVERAARYARTPRSATPVDDRVSFGGLEGVTEVDQDRTGDIYFVTISEPQQSLLSWWVAGGRSCDVRASDEVGCGSEPSIDFITREDKFGTQSPTQRRAISLQMMRTSSQVAQFVALRALGYDDAKILPGDVVVQEIVCITPGTTGCDEYAPADAELDPGDTLLRADGVTLDTIDDLVAQLAGKQPGDVVELDIDRPGAGPTTVQVPLIASPDDPTRTIVGIVPFDTASVQLPFEIDIDTGDIGGPSAGLAFTLTLIDELSAGNLTGGTDVAVTGEIDLDGNVGPIGGLAQKVAAVKQVGVRHFLVPTGQGEAQIARAREIGGDDVEIIPVATLDEALAALQRLGGDPLPDAPAGS
ncbi:MAG: S16 family serine protease [Ilumatobacteraceae bacterium]